MKVRTETRDVGKQKFAVDDASAFDNNSVMQGPEIHLDLRVERVRGAGLIAKVLTLDPEGTKQAKIQQSTQSHENLILIVELTSDAFFVNLLRLVDLHPIARLEYCHTSPMEDEIFTTPNTLVNFVTRIFDVQAHLLDSIRRRYPSYLED